MADGTEMVLDYMSPRISSEIYECGMPLTFDQYNRCAFGCKYCFAAFRADQQAHQGAGGDPELIKLQSKYRNPVRGVNPDKVTRYWREMDQDHWKRTDRLIVNLLRKGAPLHWGGMCDPFDPFEKRFRLGLELLQFFSSQKWPVVFSTKGQLMCEDDWARVLHKGNYRFQFSITTLDAVKGKVCDSGVGTPEDRLRAMKFVTQELKCDATLRFRPMIPGFVTPDEAVELIHRAHEAGASGVSTEFFCLEARGFVNRDRYKKMSRAAGFDLFEFYRRNSPGQHGYLRLSRPFKEQYFVPMARACEKLGMRFSVSDKHFKELGSVPSCCGTYWGDEEKQTRDGFPGVYINKGTLTYASLFARQHGEVRWSDLRDHLDWADVEVSSELGTIMGSTENRKKHRGQTLREVLRCYWNDPKESKSPFRYTGGKLVPKDTPDENGDLVYVYQESAIDEEFRDCGDCLGNC